MSQECPDFKYYPELKRPLSPKKRLHVIVNGLAVEGWTLERIAQECGVARRTIYRDRTDISSERLTEKLLNLQMADIAKLAGSMDSKAKSQAMHFRDRLIQKLIPRKIISESKGRIEAKMEVKIPELGEEDIARYVPVIVKLSMEAEARELNEDDDQEDPQEPVG